jgi:dTDP-4-dehydrorhamnose reductase
MILVTGASGLLGASLVSLAQERGREVVGLYHRHPIYMDGVEMRAVDLVDQRETQRIFDEVRPASVVHCAAATDVDWCEEHPDESHRVNAMIPATIAGIASRSNTRLLFISTDSVFDGACGNYAETDVPAPVNVYANTKLQGEREVLRRCPAATVARVNLYGWNAQNKESLAEWILAQLILGHIVPAFSDVIFCPALANDVAEFILALLDRNVSGLYHVAGSEPISKFEFARRVASTFGFDPDQIVPTRVSDAKLKAQRPRNTSLNTEKVSAALGRATPDVETGLRRFAQLRDSGYVERIKGHVVGVRR